MRIAQIEIENLKGIENLRIEFKGSLLVVKGENGVGKSSVIDSIRTVFEGGHDANLIRRGAKKAVVLLTLDNGTTIRKSITERNTNVEIKTGTGEVVKAPATYLKELASSFAFDPVRFVTASDKDRLAFFQRALNLEFSRAEMKETVGEMLLGNADVFSLDDVAAIRKMLYETRTRANTSADSMRGHLEQLRQSLPADGENADYAAMQAEKQGQLEDAKNDVAYKIAACREEHADVLNSYRTIRDAEIEAANAKYAACASNAERLLLESIEEARNQGAPEIDRLNAELGELKAKAEAQQRAEGTRKAIETTRTKVLALQDESKDLTAAIQRLDSLKERKLEESPIPGVDIRDGKIYHDGLPYDSLNLALKYKLSLKIASLALGELPVMIADDAEHLSRENWDALRDAVQGADLQLVVARVESDCGLTVESAA